MEYLLNYIEDFELEYIKEQYTEETLELLVALKDNVIERIKELKNKNNNIDIYNELTTDINQFF